MSSNDRAPHALLDRFARWAGRRAGLLVTAALALTAALAVPFLALPPDESASQEPAGEVFDARDRLAERLGSDVVELFFVVEARDGDLLDRDGLAALQERVEALRSDPELGSVLLDRSPPGEGPALAGTQTLADAVTHALTEHGTGPIREADPDTVRAVTSAIIDEQGAAAVNLSRQADRDADGRWSSPAVTLDVLLDGTQIEGLGAAGGFATDIAVEEVGREIQDVLRASEALHVWGVALDQTLTGQEQGEAAGPFIGFTVLALVLLVGLLFRSYWVLAVTGAALIALVLWLGGLANLLGLKEGQILATIVPIAMLAFGVDYAFHAVGRYREERAGGAVLPALAIRRGMVGVLPALTLAVATGAAAFLANTTSGIESIVQFGVAATGALVAAFVVLGLVVPLAVSWIDQRTTSAPSRWGRPLALLGGGAAASTAMAAVLFAVFLSPPVGLAIFAAYLVVFCIAPLAVATRRSRTTPPATHELTAPGRGALPQVIARLVGAVAARRWVVLPAVAVLTAGAAVLAVQVPTEFDAEDFFAPDTDFVLGLTKLDEHVGDQGGEPATVLVETDLSDPAAIARLDAFAGALAALDTPLLAREDGAVAVRRGVLVLVDAFGDRPADLEAAFDRARSEGLRAPDGGVVVAAPAARQMISEVGADGLRATALGVGLVGSRSQENVTAARALVDPLVDDLASDLREIDPSSQATLTGTPIEREASLAAVSTALRTSLPIALLACFACAALALRSWRYALVATVPIVLVVAWLYAFMELAGFAVNLVTATIGAISIGVGIDFAIHLTMRFREELAVRPTRAAALDAAAAGTGTALVGSAVTSVVGFTILAFAPMPMFASFGLLTAVMIVMALLATLFVLPSLLLTVSREPSTAAMSASVEETPAVTAPAPQG